MLIVSSSDLWKEQSKHNRDVHLYQQYCVLLLRKEPEMYIFHPPGPVSFKECV